VTGGASPPSSGAGISLAPAVVAVARYGRASVGVSRAAAVRRRVVRDPDPTDGMLTSSRPYRPSSPSGRVWVHVPVGQRRLADDRTSSTGRMPSQDQRAISHRKPRTSVPRRTGRSCQAAKAGEPSLPSCLGGAGSGNRTPRTVGLTHRGFPGMSCERAFR